ncbi:MAG: macro domain-containing protein [Actinobacteria bacterium]|nr:macro domain-containing protein [Actinomycetota bacterium]
MSSKYKIGNSILEILTGDITLQDTDVIVNAANNALVPGGGVDGAIHRAAGPELKDECETLGGCETGEAKITRGYNLAAPYVIHTVGPVYSGRVSDPGDLERSYLNSLSVASSNGLKSISFPSISTGAFGYPVKEAAVIALKSITGYLKNHPDIELVRMVLFSDRDYQVYRSTMERIIIT